MNHQNKPIPDELFDRILGFYRDFIANYDWDHSTEAYERPAHIPWLYVDPREPESAMLVRYSWSPVTGWEEDDYIPLTDGQLARVVETTEAALYNYRQEHPAWWNDDEDDPSLEPMRFDWETGSYY